MSTNPPPPPPPPSRSRWQLWKPWNGILFTSAAPRQRQLPLYPTLDTSRFVHNAGVEDRRGQARDQDAAVYLGDARGEGARPETAAASSEGSIANPPAGEIIEGGAGGEQRRELEQERGQEQEQGRDGQDGQDDDLPFTTLEYNMSEEAFRAAKLAAPGTPESFWSYTLYRGPGEDGSGDAKVKVHYCRSKHTTEQVCQYFLNEKVIGFDLEWMPDATRWQGARRNVCLAQLASESRIALFHLSLYPKADSLVAPSFKKIMEDPEITKAGVWIGGDCTRLRTYLDIHARGTFELSHLYKLVKYSAPGESRLINKKLVSLATQVHEHLGLPMFKGHDVRSSDWSQPLRMDQIIYSASDAYAAVQLFDVLERKRESLDPTPPRPFHAELGKPIPLAAGANVAEQDDAADDAEIKWEDKVPTVLSRDFVDLAVVDIKIESETDAAEPAKPRKKLAAQQAKDARILAAETWLVQHRIAYTKTRAAPAALRAYHIWNASEDLDAVAIAKLLREPPLQTSTVASYILDAIKLDKLPYHTARLRTQVLDLMPKQVLEARYRTLVKACNENQDTQET